MAVAVSVIIPNLNGAALLPRCLEALARQSFREFEVIVVDNGSTDGSGRAAPPADLELRLIALESNAGFTGACNRGFRESRGRFIAILNNDAVPDPGWLAALVAAAESKWHRFQTGDTEFQTGDTNIGMVASRVLSMREPGTVDSLGLLPARNGLVYLRGMGEPDRPDSDLPATEEVFGPSGVAALYRREMLDQIGFLAEPYFAYYEDADLAFRGRWAGWRCLLANQARVRHWHSATADAMDLPKTYYLHRNRLWTIWRDWPLAAFVRHFPWFFLYSFLTVWRAILFEGNLHAVKARMDAVMGLGQQLQWRWTQQRLRTVPGAEISRWLSTEYPGLVETHRRKRAHETRA